MIDWELIKKRKEQRLLKERARRTTSEYLQKRKERERTPELLQLRAETRESRVVIKTWVGIDGEGKTLGKPSYINMDKSTARTGVEHRYVSMSYRDILGNGDETFHESGLSTKDCLEFILSIPETHKIAAFGFGYDQTKIIEELTDNSIYRLTHPEIRSFRNFKGRTQYHPVEWHGYVLDHFNTVFKVGRAIPGRKSPLGTQHYLGKDWRTIFDLIQFYQCSFVNACKLWKIGTQEKRNIMREMKKDRRNLVKYTQKQILDYSNLECQWLAELATKLDEACEKVGITLGRAYYGAGSIAKELLRKWDIDKQLPTKYKSDNNRDVSAIIEKLARSAYFGGRFEISRRGLITIPIHDWDISNAYPYQIFQLPCLLHGIWSRTLNRDDINQANIALVRYSLRPWKGNLPPWGPFPFRDKDGSIPYPIESDGGWVHKHEFLAGEKLFPNIKFHGAWIYKTQCDCHPFKEISKVYLERLRIGKEGPGIVLKLGANAVAGSIMQTVGTRPYFNPIWSGMITSGTRAQLLEMLACHENMSDVVMMATDGLWSTKKVSSAPKPINTDTDIDVVDESNGKTVRKPMGGWEWNELKNGVFLARPGIYMPLGLKEISDEENETEDDIIKDVKGRGIGVKTLYKHRHEIIAHYEKTRGKTPYYIADKNPLRVIEERDEPIGCERFVGLRGGIIQNKSGECHRRSVFGVWTLQKRVLDFNAMPKRTEGDGPLFDKEDKLLVRRMPKGQLSEPYNKMRPDDPFGDLREQTNDPTYFDSDQNDWGD